MREWIRRAAGRPAGTKASATAQVVALAAGGRARWTPRDAASLARSGFGRNPVAFRAVRMIAEAAAALPLICEVGGRRLELHPVLERLARPNPAEGGAEFLEALYAQLVLTGDVFVEAVPGAGAPAELYVLRSDRMRMEAGADGWPRAWIYEVGGRRHRFDATADPAPVLHMRLYNPLDDHFGLAPLAAAAAAIDVHNAASAWSKALLDNAARPSGAIVYRGADGSGMLSPDQYRRLVEEIEAYHTGARNAGRPMLLEGGLDWKPMGYSPADMEFQKTKEAAAREIALAFGVPPMLIGLPGDATYANYREANRAFYRMTVLPLAQKVLARLGDWLGAHCGEPVRLRPDLEAVTALAPERESLWARVAAADFLTEAEKRRLLGLAPLGDEAGAGSDGDGGR